MEVEILTIFPEIFDGFLSTSLISKACERNLLKITRTNIRDFADLPHRHVDDTPYGGGAGMVMKPEPIAKAIESAKNRLPSAPVILLTPRGTPFSQPEAVSLSKLPQVILVCGRYEGIDQRAIDLLVDKEISIGDYVLMGGEVPAMAVLESCVRLIDDVVGNPESLSEESFSTNDHSGQGLLEGPQFTRPPEFRGEKVPEILLSGDHAKIASWRLEQSRKITTKRRPDLLQRREESGKSED